MIIAGTQADARAVNKQFEQFDIPTDKAGLLAIAQSWCDEVFELNKLMDEMRADLEGRVPEREETSTEQPPTPSNVPEREEFVTEVRRQISVEEEIQSCDLPRLAVLAQNVAWRFEELARCPSSPSVTT
ncbi:hypothetical protein [Sphingopyxis flava]|nr:hypothetical protein [Sphingopyxis flava]